MSDFLDVSRSLGLSTVWPIARQCSFYREAIGDFSSITFGRLADFPITTKADLRENPEGFCPGNKFPDYIQLSGGKSGPPAILFSDATWTSEVYSQFERSAVPDTPRPIMLKASGGSQGTAPLIPGKVGAIEIPFRTRQNYQLAIDLIQRKYAFDGFKDHVSTLLLPLPLIKKLIHFLLENRYDCGDWNISKVFSFSHFLSRKWRSRIESFWNCELIDVYGITEVRASRAASCSRCGFFHFNDKIIFEVVDVATNRRINSGRGKLLLTTLSNTPFISPVLIRYDTDDIVEIGPQCEIFGESGIRPIGKRRDFLSEGPASTMLELAPADVLEELDTDPSVARTEPIRFAEVTSNNDDAAPKWNWKLGRAGTKPSLNLFVELKFDPDLFPEAYSVWKSQKEERLRNAVAARSRAGAIELEVTGVAQGKLADKCVIF